MTIPVPKKDIPCIDGPLHQSRSDNLGDTFEKRVADKVYTYKMQLITIRTRTMHKGVPAIFDKIGWGYVCKESRPESAVERMVRARKESAARNDKGTVEPKGPDQGT